MLYAMCLSVRPFVSVINSQNITTNVVDMLINFYQRQFYRKSLLSLICSYVTKDIHNALPYMYVATIQKQEAKLSL